MSVPKKILIVRNDHIGDFVLSTAIFRELKKKYPKSKIVLITSKVNKCFAEVNPNIDEIWELEIPNYDFGTILNYIKMSWRIRKENFDVGIDLRGSLLISSLLLWFGGVKKIIGKCDNYASLLKNKLTSLFQTTPIKTDFYSNKRHVIEDNIYIINKGLKLEIRDSWPEIITEKKDQKEVNEYLKNKKLERYFCIFPITDQYFKQWPIEKFKKLVKWLEKFNLKILLMGTKNQKTKLQEIAKFNKKSEILIDYNLRKMSLLFKKSKLVIAPDIGPMHISWISKAKTLEIVARTPKEVALGKLRPLGNSKIVWSKDVDIRSINLRCIKQAIKPYLV